MVALNGANRSIFEIPVYAGLSIPFPSHGKLEPTVASVEVKAPEPTPVPEVVTAPEPVVAEAPKVAVQFDAKLVTFDLNKSTLKPESEEFLTKVAQILIAQQDNWKGILISGHTDVSGNAHKNRVLSDRRAKTVMDWLIKEGVPGSRLTSKGFGSDKLLPDEVANSEKHRRVELLFDGVLDGVKINDAFSALKSAQ